MTDNLRSPSRDERVLAELARNGAGEIAFQGLKRRLGLHPQALSRVLNRLQAAGQIERGEAGYRLGPKSSLAVQVTDDARTYRPVFIAVAPPNLTQADLATRLARRWFNGLRWYGQRVHEDAHELVWMVAESGHTVRVRIQGNLIGVEAEAASPEASIPFHALASLIASLGGYYQRVPPGLPSPRLANGFVPRLAG